MICFAVEKSVWNFAQSLAESFGYSVHNFWFDNRKKCTARTRFLKNCIKKDSNVLIKTGILVHIKCLFNISHKTCTRVVYTFCCNYDNTPGGFVCLIYPYSSASVHWLWIIWRLDRCIWSDHEENRAKRSTPDHNKIQQSVKPGDTRFRDITSHTIDGAICNIPTSASDGLISTGDYFFTFGPHGRRARSARRPRGQNAAAIAPDRRFLGTIIAIFKMWLCPFNQPCIRHPMTKLK